MAQAKKKLGRPKKLSINEVEHAALDRRKGMSWKALSIKYKCATNTLRTALLEYSDEFKIVKPVDVLSLVRELKETQNELNKIKAALKKRFNLHV